MGEEQDKPSSETNQQPTSKPAPPPPPSSEKLPPSGCFKGENLVPRPFDTPPVKRKEG